MQNGFSGLFVRPLGADYFDNLDKERLTRQALRRLEALGYTVTLTPKQEEVS